MSTVRSHRTVVFCVIVVLMVVLSGLTGVTGLFVDRFSDDSIQANVTFAGAGYDNSTGLRLPAKGVVIDTTLRASSNALDVTVDVGADGNIDWGFLGQGYGRLGAQDMFEDGTTELDLALTTGLNMTKDLLLPKTSNIIDAQVTFEGKGTVNMSWSSDRTFTMFEGKNIVEVGFKDKAFLVPEIKDLELDGDLDLLVGYQSYSSPSSGELSYFLNRGPASDPSYNTNDTFDTISISETYIHPTLTDVDTDNDYDFVYGSIDGRIRFYKNDGTINTPSWSVNTTLFAGIDVGDYSAPSFADLNGDGKMDMVVGNSNGDFFFFNNTGSASTPTFTEEVSFFTGISVNNYATPHMSDIDGDSDYDMISGDGSGNILMFQNNGTTSEPNIEANTIYFGGVWPVSYRSTISTFDADGDGDLDVCAGYANPRLAIWKNQQGDGAPTPWDIMSEFWLGNSTSLNGPASAIELVDLNGDGLEDLVEVTDDSRFFTHDQIHNSWGVAFDANQSSFGGYQDATPNMDPTFADLDNDGDLDMLVGEDTGELTFFRNTGTISVPSWQKVASWPPVSGIDQGTYSAPELGDLDGNGLPDLIIGAEDGTLTYYTNTGTANNPVFTQNTSLFGSIAYGVNGRTVPELYDVDGDSDLDLIVSYSTPNGWSTTPDLYLNDGNVNVPSFTKNDEVIGVLGYITESAHVGLVDTDLDGDHDLILGGDLIERLYHLECDPSYNIGISVGNKTTAFNEVVSSSSFDVDISSILTSSLTSSQATVDQYGNPMSRLSLKIEALRNFNAKATLRIEYSYGAIMSSLVGTLNDYVANNQDIADVDDMITVPINVSALSAGTVRMFGLNVTVDEPPVLMGPYTGLSVDEDTKEAHLIDLLILFDDDFTGDNDLVFNMEVSDTPINVTLLQDRWVSVDAETGPENDNWTGEVSVRINGTDLRNLTTTTGWFNITIASVNDDPVIHSSPPRTAIVDHLYEYSINASDIDGDTLEYGLALNPNGMIINSTSGHVRWMPMVADQGPHQVKLTVKDGSVVLNQTYTLNVLPEPAINHPPVIVSEPVTIAYAGMIYQYNVDATDEDEDALNYLLPPSTRPDGMMINFTNGVINWVPTVSQIGEHNITVIVTDNKDNATQNFTISVEEIDLPPQITSSPKTTANVGILYSYTVTATDPEGTTPSFRLAAGPTGMTIDGNTGEIIWLPTADDIGTVSVRVEVSDVNNVVNQSFSIIVSYLQPTVSITSPRSGDKVSGTITIKGISSISSGNLVKIEVKVDDRDWKEAEGRESWTYKLDTNKLSDGEHTITIRAVSEHTESELKTVIIKVKNEESLSSETLMLLSLLLVLVIVIVAAVAGMVMLRKKMRNAEAQEKIVAPVRVSKRAEEEEEVTDEEMDHDLEEMEKEMHEDDVSDEDMDEDLALMTEETSGSEE